MNNVNATLLQRAWRKIDVKVSIDGEMHVLRWRRGLFIDEVLFDEARIATATGLFGRETIYGLDIEAKSGARVKFVFMIDVSPDWDDWTGDMRPRGVRLETADRRLIAIGSLGPDRTEPFLALFDRAVKAIGLS